MTKSMGALLVGAALAGFVAGTTTTVNATGNNALDPGANAGEPAGKPRREKHACKGQNSCKGKGGCGSTKARNDCKGKGDCRTDGRRMSAAMRRRMGR
jgi:hypothetical protein